MQGGGIAGLGAQIRRQPRSYWGMVVAHLGIAVCVVGITMVKGYETERDVKMGVGDTVTVAGYVFRFDGVTEQRRTRTTARRAAASRSAATARMSRRCIPRSASTTPAACR